MFSTEKHMENFFPKQWTSSFMDDIHGKDCFRKRAAGLYQTKIQTSEITYFMYMFQKRGLNFDWKNKSSKNISKIDHIVI